MDVNGRVYRGTLCNASYEIPLPLCDLTKYYYINCLKLVRIPAWIIVWGVQLAIVFGVRNWNAYDRPSMVMGILYGALFRFWWSLCVAWTVYACATGNGGLVNRILSFRAWIPLSRLTFLVYLVHPLIILAHTAYLREPYYITVPFTVSTPIWNCQS